MQHEILVWPASIALPHVHRSAYISIGPPALPRHVDSIYSAGRRRPLLAAVSSLAAAHRPPAYDRDISSAKRRIVQVPNQPDTGKHSRTMAGMGAMCAVAHRHETQADLPKSLRSQTGRRGRRRRCRVGIRRMTWCAGRRTKRRASKRTQRCLRWSDRTGARSVWQGHESASAVESGMHWPCCWLGRHQGQWSRVYCCQRHRSCGRPLCLRRWR